MDSSSLAGNMLWDLCWHSLIFFLVTALGYVVISGSLYSLFFLRNGSNIQPIDIKHLRTKHPNNDRTLNKIWTTIRHDVVLSIWSSAIF
ncbi:MAG: hypothetical protein AAF528_11540, partial [Cyanobacteria bacterium P01_C01_bin.121]